MCLVDQSTAQLFHDLEVLLKSLVSRQVVKMLQKLGGSKYESANVNNTTGFKASLLIQEFHFQFIMLCHKKFQY